MLVSKSTSIKIHGDIYSYDTRNYRDNNIPAHQLAIFEGKPSYAGARFVVLPLNLEKTAQVKLWTGLTEWFQLFLFYSINDFLDWKNF